MRRLDFARFITQDATLKCGNDFLSLSARLLTGSCTSDWLKLKAHSGSEAEIWSETSAVVTRVKQTTAVYGVLHATSCLSQRRSEKSPNSHKSVLNLLETLFPDRYVRALHLKKNVF